MILLSYSFPCIHTYTSPKGAFCRRSGVPLRESAYSRTSTFLVCAAVLPWEVHSPATCLIATTASLNGIRSTFWPSKEIQKKGLLKETLRIKKWWKLQQSSIISLHQWHHADPESVIVWLSEPLPYLRLLLTGCSPTLFIASAPFFYFGFRKSGCSLKPYFSWFETCVVPPPHLSPVSGSSAKMTLLLPTIPS